MADPRDRTLLWILVGGGAFFLFMLAVFTITVLTLDDGRENAGLFGDKIAVVELKGVILDPEQVVKDLKKFGEDDSVKAVILHINTPGGGAAASQEIYEAVKRVRDEKKKRVVASIETVGASGGYYVAMGANKIYANPAAIVGSIGVIAQWVNYGELLRWAKLKDVTMKAGELKDTGSPTREMTPEERKYLQGLIDDMHAQFIAAVAEGRKMKVEEITPLASGRVWTGLQAKPLKLVDEVGDFQKAVEDTAKDVGIKGEPQLVRAQRERRTLLDLMFEDLSDVIPSRAKLLEQNPGFYYLWR